MTEIHRLICGNVNCYIVTDHGNAILVDTGRVRHRDMVLEKCRKFGVGLIVLTHGHLDHCQNAAYLAGRLRIPIAMSERDENLIPDNRNQPLSAKTLPGKLVLAASLASFEKDRLDAFVPTIALREGESLASYGVDAKVIELPGHTDGSIGLETETGLLVGDALMNLFYPTVSMLYTDEEAMRKSVARIGKLGDRKIYFGHGRPTDNRWKEKG